MVDFDNDATIGTPSVDVTRIILLQYRYDAKESYEKYRKSLEAGVEGNTSLLKARIFTWFMEMRSMFKRKYPKEYDALFEKAKSMNTEDDILDMICLLDDECDKMMLTRIDTRAVYDSSRVERENRVKKL